MNRRNWIKATGVTIASFLGIKVAKAENPNKLPVLKFKDRRICNPDEIFGNDLGTKLCWVNKEDTVGGLVVGHWGEVRVIRYHTTPSDWECIAIEQTKNTNTVYFNNHLTVKENKNGTNKT